MDRVRAVDAKISFIAWHLLPCLLLKFFWPCVGPTMNAENVVIMVTANTCDHGYSNNCDHGYSKQPERTIATMITAENPRYRDLLTLFKELSLLLSMPMLL